jgi:hypothetical protein
MTARGRWREVRRSWRQRAQGLQQAAIAIEDERMRDVVVCIVDVLASDCGSLIIEDNAGEEHAHVVGVRLDDECAAAIRNRNELDGNDLLVEALRWLRSRLADQDVAFVAWAVGRLERRDGGCSVFEGPDGVGWDIAKHKPVTIVVDGKTLAFPADADLGL